MARDEQAEWLIRVSDPEDGWIQITALFRRPNLFGRLEVEWQQIMRLPLRIATQLHDQLGRVLEQVVQDSTE